MATLDENGREILDQTPMALPVNYNRPVPIHERIRQMILQHSMDQHAGFETIDEFNDFEIPDDPSSRDDFTTIHEEEPDYTPRVDYTPEEIAAARAAVENLRRTQAPESANQPQEAPQEAPAAAPQPPQA